MKNPFNFSIDFIKGFLIASLLFVVTAISIIINTLAIKSTVNFIANHNFAVAKYAGEISYVADDVNDLYPHVTDTEGINHVFFEQEGARTIFLFSRYEPRDGTFLQVFEVKLYNSKTQRLRLLRLVW